MGSMGAYEFIRKSGLQTSSPTDLHVLRAVHQAHKGHITRHKSLYGRADYRQTYSRPDTYLPGQYL